MMNLVVGSCEETGEFLSSRMEGELRGLRRLRVSAHLWRCDGCRVVLGSLSRTVERLGAIGQAGFAPPLRPSVSSVVIERIRLELS